MSQWQRQAALAAAQKGLTSATMRYSAVQSALTFLGPVMWAWLAVDLVRAAVGTDYARVVRAVYILAQVRDRNINIEKMHTCEAQHCTVLRCGQGGSGYSAAVYCQPCSPSRAQDHSRALVHVLHRLLGRQHMGFYKKMSR